MADTLAVPGSPCWVDLTTADPERARAFYPELLGWTPEEASAEFGGYFMFTRGGAPIAGAAPHMPGDDSPDTWKVYFATDDIDASVSRIGASAGEVLVNPMAVGDLGTMALFSDATGAIAGIWQAGTFSGFAPGADQVGAPIWFELHATEYGLAVGFYTSALGWTTETMSDTDDFRYATATRSGEQFAGIFDASRYLPPGVPAHWEVYFAVSDVDQAAAAVTTLGGTIVTEPADSPYGRLATVTDPMGALFRVIAR